MIEIVAIAEGEKRDVLNDLQAYIGELAAYDPSIKAVNGIYRYDDIDLYWREPDHWPFWVKVDGIVAGFAFVRHSSDKAAFEMADFYIRPTCRRSGIGLEFARTLIARFPGSWILSQYKAKTDSIAFWRRVIAGRTFTERAYTSANGNARIEQAFES